MFGIISAHFKGHCIVAMQSCMPKRKQPGSVAFGGSEILPLCISENVALNLIIRWTFKDIKALQIFNFLLFKLVGTTASEGFSWEIAK